VFLVVQATADQWLVGVAFEKVHQHFHADARDGDGAVAVAGPAGGDPQPAAGLVVTLAFAVPMELHLDPAVLVGVDLFSGRAGNHRGLAAQRPRLGVFQGGAEEHLPGGGEKAVAVALLEAVARIAVAADRFLQHLGLLAFVADLGQQPEVIPFLARVIGQFKKMPADQSRFIAPAFGLQVVGAMAFQSVLAEEFAPGTVGEAPGIVVILQFRFLDLGFGLIGGLHLQARLFEVVVTPGDTIGARLDPDLESLDHRIVRHQPAALHVGGGRPSLRNTLWLSLNTSKCASRLCWKW